MTGFEMIDRGIPRQHYSLFNNRLVNIGEVTSGTMSPCLKQGIGMAYVQTRICPVRKRNICKYP